MDIDDQILVEMILDNEFDEYIKNNVYDKSILTWVHAVKTKDALVTAIRGDVNLIEADIVMGTLKGCTDSTQKMPIMAHPPVNTSDFSFRNFISTAIAEWCDKPIKLDFKNTEAVSPALAIIKEYKRKINFPIWINADVLKGTFDKSITFSQEVNPREVLQQLKVHDYRPAMLSFGWTTGIHRDSRYTWDDVTDMASLLLAEKVDYLLTFPVRASYVGRSLPQLQWLLSVFPKSSLTVWSSFIDKPDLEGLLQVRRSVSPDRVYYDLLGPLQNDFKKKKYTVQYAQEKIIGFTPGTKFPLSSATPAAVYDAPEGVVLAKYPALFMMGTVLDLNLDRFFSLSGYVEVYPRNLTSEYISKKFGLVLVKEIESVPTSPSTAEMKSVFTVSLQGYINDSVRLFFYFDTSPNVTVELRSQLPSQLQYELKTNPDLAMGNCTYQMGVWNNGGKGDVVFYHLQDETGRNAATTPLLRSYLIFLALLVLLRSI